MDSARPPSSEARKRPKPASPFPGGVPIPRIAPDDELSLLLDEAWALEDAGDELARRRMALHDLILRICEPTGVEVLPHARGAARIERWSAYEVARASALAPTLATLGWTDAVLRVDGRALHALAQPRPDVRALLARSYREQRRAALVLAPARARRAPEG